MAAQIQFLSSQAGEQAQIGKFTRGSVSHLFLRGHPMNRLVSRLCCMERRMAEKEKELRGRQD